MTIHFDIPDDVAQNLAADGRDISRAALEAFGVEEYRAGRLTQSQLRRLLGYETRMEVDGFLKEHQVWLEYTMEDLERESQIGDQLWNRRQEELAQEAEIRRAG
jgi:Uncharacterised protein family (UPF0175)